MACSENSTARTPMPALLDASAAQTTEPSSPQRTSRPPCTSPCHTSRSRSMGAAGLGAAAALAGVPSNAAQLPFAAAPAAAGLMGAFVMGPKISSKGSADRALDPPAAAEPPTKESLPSAKGSTLCCEFWLCRMGSWYPPASRGGPAACCCCCCCSTWKPGSGLMPERADEEPKLRPVSWSTCLERLLFATPYVTFGLTVALLGLCPDAEEERPSRVARASKRASGAVEQPPAATRVLIAR
mmetsp:Transcript_29038/g.64108  ORF Transcript_29038/g.64108 Transcript_29038/m.64108 type:complete len:241 (+) Transcript_29038:862-1584(+)